MTQCGSASSPRGAATLPAALAVLASLAGLCPASPAFADWRTSYAGISLNSYLLRENVMPPFCVSWAFTAEEPFRDSALIAVDTVFLVTRSGRVRAFAADNGRERWSFDGPGAEHDAFSLDALTGRLRWRKSLDGRVVHAAQAGRGAQFIATDTGRLYAILQDDGRVCWQNTYGGPLTLPAADGELVVVGCGSSVLGLDTNTGKRLWSFAGLSAPLKFHPCLTRDGVYVPDGRRVVALDRGGRLRWTASYRLPAGSPLAISASGIIAASIDGTVRCYGRGTGAMAWETIVAGKPSSLAGAGDAIFAGTERGTVVCLDVDQGAKLWCARAAEGRIDGIALSGGRLVVTSGTWAGSLLPSPEPPDGVVARRENGRVRVRWDASRPNPAPIDSYTVWRRMGRGAWEIVETVSASILTLVVNDARTASFAVTATARDGGRSEPSREAVLDSADPLLANLRATPLPLVQGRGPVRVDFQLRESARIDWQVVDVEGTTVTEETSVLLPRGSGRVEWDGRDRFLRGAPAGTYAIRLRATAGFEAMELASAVPVVWPSGGAPPEGISGPRQGGSRGPEGTGSQDASTDEDRSRGDRGVRDHGRGEGRDGAGQGKGQGFPHGEKQGK